VQAGDEREGMIHFLLPTKYNSLMKRKPEESETRTNEITYRKISI
jgi:hypothetical protein